MMTSTGKVNFNEVLKQSIHDLQQVHFTCPKPHYETDYKVGYGIGYIDEMSTYPSMDYSELCDLDSRENNFKERPLITRGAVIQQNISPRFVK